MTRRCTLLFIFLLPLQSWAAGPALVEDSNSDDKQATLSATVDIDPPLGWTYLPDLSASLTKISQQNSFWNDKPTKSAAKAYGSGTQSALYLTWVTGLSSELSPEESIRIAFDRIHEAPFLANETAGVVQENSYRESTLNGIAVLDWQWAHTSNETVNLVRSFAWKDDHNKVHLAIAECMIVSVTADSSLPLCETALQSLRLQIDTKQVPLRSLAPPTFSPGLQAQDIQIPKLKTGTARPGTTIGVAPNERGKIIYEGKRPPNESNHDNRIFIAIGILLLGVAYWLTTRTKSEPGKSEETDTNEETSQ